MPDTARNKKPNNTKLRIESAVLAAIDLRDSVFEIGDEPLIRALDLVIYALGAVAARNRVENAPEDYGCTRVKKQTLAA